MIRLYVLFRITCISNILNKTQSAVKSLSPHIIFALTQHRPSDLIIALSTSIFYVDCNYLVSCCLLSEKKIIGICIQWLFYYHYNNTSYYDKTIVAEFTTKHETWQNSKISQCTLCCCIYILQMKLITFWWAQYRLFCFKLYWVFSFTQYRWFY